MATVIDFYSESNKSAANQRDSVDGIGMGQSFTGNGTIVGTAQWYCKRINSPTGNCFAKIYAITGTFGTNSKPTGAAIATSDAVDVSTIGSVIFTLVTFTFSGGNQVTLTNGVHYALTFEYTGGDGSN